MNQSKILFVILLIIGVAGQSNAEVINGTGGPMMFESGYGTENQGSSLLREWAIFNDDNLPVDLKNFDSQVYLGTQVRGYRISYDIDAAEDVKAIEARFIPFDVWGNMDIPLSAAVIQDISAGAKSLEGEWSSSSEPMVTHHFAMLGYIARVKLASGEIVEANPELVVEAARRFSSEFSAADLLNKP